MADVFMCANLPPPEALCISNVLENKLGILWDDLIDIYCQPGANFDSQHFRSLMKEIVGESLSALQQVRVYRAMEHLRVQLKVQL